MHPLRRNSATPADGDERIIGEVWSDHPDGSSTHVAEVLARSGHLVLRVYGEHPALSFPHQRSSRPSSSVWRRFERLRVAAQKDPPLQLPVTSAAGTLTGTF